MSDHITDLMDRLQRRAATSRHDLMNHAAVLDQLDMQDTRQRTIKRSESQADVLWKSMAGDCYDPPDEDDMSGSTIISGNVIADEGALLALVKGDKAEPEAKPPPATETPPPAGQQAARPGRGLLRTLLPMAAAAVIGGGAAFGVSALYNALNPDTDTTNRFDLRALPFDPEL